MIADQHIVEKVMVEVDVNSLELAEKIKSEMNDFIQNEVLSVVESYFSELDLPESLSEKVIQLDKVDLSIEAASWNPQSTRLKQEIRDEVVRQMNPIIQELKDQTSRNKESAPKGYSDIKEPRAEVYSKEERVLKSMFYFLDHGTLPWWVQSVEESRELFTEKSLISALNEQTGLARREFQKRRANPRFVERLVQQFSLPVVSELVQIDLSRSQMERKKITSDWVEEFKTVPTTISSKLLHLLVELSEPSVITGVSNDGVPYRLYQHITKVFYAEEKSERQYESALKATDAALRTLYLLGGRASNLNRAKSEFQKSLKKELPVQVFSALKETKTYREVFSSQFDSSNEKAEISSERKHESTASEKDEDSLDTTESVGRQVQFEAEIESEKKGGEEEIAGRVDSSESQTETHSEKSQEVKASAKTEDVSETGVEKSAKDSPSEERAIDDRTDEENGRPSEKEKSRDVRSEEKGGQSEGIKDINDPDFTKNAAKEIETSSESVSDERKEIVSSDSESASASAKAIENRSKQEKSTEKDIDRIGEVLKKRGEEEFRAKKMEDKMPDHLLVENAGLVLLNPFLPALFKHLDLVDTDGKLTDPEVAACLLHYAATGREGDYEFEMTFEKYLCGIPPSFSLSRDIILTEVQKNEVEKVLNSVMQHWTALKSKSTELLQNEFLSRSGKLIVEKSNHRLVVEKKTFDLLLDKLPWSYSLIKFSWKKELMFVEW